MHAEFGIAELRVRLTPLDECQRRKPLQSKHSCHPVLKKKILTATRVLCSHWTRHIQASLMDNCIASGSTQDKGKNISQSRKREEMAPEPGFRRDEGMLFACSLRLCITAKWKVRLKKPQQNHVLLSAPANITGQISNCRQGCLPTWIAHISEKNRVFWGTVLPRTLNSSHDKLTSDWLLLERSF